MSSAIDREAGWHIDPVTLLPVLVDEAAFRAANASDPALEVLVALWSGNPDRAAELLRPLIDADPTSWRLQALAADVIRDRGDAGSAITVLDALVSENEGTPREAVLVQHLGKALFVAGDFPGAAAKFQRALSLRLADDADPALVGSSRQALDRALELVPRRFGALRADPPRTGLPKRPGDESPHQKGSALG
ncbi:tetratricopeptide repeat protein [Promicromonospora sukumoe]